MEWLFYGFIIGYGSTFFVYALSLFIAYTFETRRNRKTTTLIRTNDGEWLVLPPGLEYLPIGKAE